METRTVLILGGGIGDVVAANRLRKRLDRRHRVIPVARRVPSARASSKRVLDALASAPCE
jgi:NADH dehydrogenase FAD-containing subunit